MSVNSEVFALLLLQKQQGHIRGIAGIAIGAFVLEFLSIFVIEAVLLYVDLQYRKEVFIVSEWFCVDGFRGGSPAFFKEALDRRAFVC